jgi:Zn-dependent protease
MGKQLGKAAGLDPEAGYLHLGSVWGIPIMLHLSWLLVAGVLGWSLATYYYPTVNPAWQTGTLWTAAAVGAVLVSASVLLHEVGHAAAAVRDRVPVKSINLLMFGGATRVGQKSPTAAIDFRIAIAGPLTSLALAGVFSLLAVTASQGSALRATVSLLATINLILAATNLIPAFPLDGGRALRAVFWRLTGSRRDATHWASWSGQAAALGFLALGIATALLASVVPGLLLAAVGLYLWNVANTSLKQLRLRELVAGLRVRDVVMVPCLAVPSGLRLDDLVEARAGGEDQPCYLVMGEEGPEGLVLGKAFEDASRRGWQDLPASEIMTPVASMDQASADDDAWDLLERMVGGEIKEIPVTDNGRFLGLLTRDNLWNQIRGQSARA